MIHVFSKDNVRLLFYNQKPQCRSLDTNVIMSYRWLSNLLRHPYDIETVYLNIFAISCELLRITQVYCCCVLRLTCYVFHMKVHLVIFVPSYGRFINSPIEHIYICIYIYTCLLILCHTAALSSHLNEISKVCLWHMNKLLSHPYGIASGSMPYGWDRKSFDLGNISGGPSYPQ